MGSRGLIRDVSERTRTEQMLRDAKEAAETRAAELDAVNRVAAGVALITEDGQNLEVVAFHSPLPRRRK